MNVFKKILYGLCLSAILLVCLGSDGCEKEFERIDKTAQATKEITVEGEKFIESPAGEYIPPEIKQAIGVVGALALILANGWQAWRNQTMKKTTKAIVKGIEDAENLSNMSGNSKSPNSVKDCIEAEMKAAKIFDRGNKIVDKLKIA